MERRSIAYFSMEIALWSEAPNYAGGLGVLAADILLSAADMGAPLAGVSLLYHQNDDPAYALNSERYLTRRPETVGVEIEGRSVKLAIWEKEIAGLGGRSVPIYFLSAYLPENKPWDRDLTKYLYAPDRYTRLCQEAILGVGGVRALAAMGYGADATAYHLNEGHAALAALELLRSHGYDEEEVRRRVTFTTHTPIPAGHDYFDYDLAGRVLQGLLPWNIRDLAGARELGMTQLAMSLSKRTNSVSARHRIVCEEMFPGKEIRNVTNGMYAPRWAGEHMAELFDTYISGWRENPALFLSAPERLPPDALRAARAAEKADLIRWINMDKAFFPLERSGPGDLLDPRALTIGFARRTVPYKRPDLVFRDIERLAAMAGGGLQFVFANRCHAGDSFCNDLRSRLADYAERLRGRVRVALVPDYDLHIARRLVAGCDVWLNTPVPPLEASGTSGMKAALNGGLNLSVRDGWWIEGLEREPLSGWGFGGERHADEARQDEADAAALMEALTEAAACYGRTDEWTDRMGRAVALAGYFNTTRVVEEYGKAIWNATR